MDLSKIPGKPKRPPIIKLEVPDDTEEQEFELQPEETPSDRRIGMGTSSETTERAPLDQNNEDAFEVEHEDNPINRAATLQRALEGKLNAQREKLKAKYEHYQAKIKNANDETNLEFISHCLEQESLHPDFADIFREAQRVACEELLSRYNQRIGTDENIDRLGAKIRVETIKNTLDYELSVVEKEAQSVNKELAEAKKQLSAKTMNPALAEKVEALTEKSAKLAKEKVQYLTLLQESKGEAGARIDGAEELLKRLSLP